jgi:hypothetical protein
VFTARYGLYLCVLCGSQNKQRLFHCTAKKGGREREGGRTGESDAIRFTTNIIIVIIIIITG